MNLATGHTEKWTEQCKTKSQAEKVEDGQVSGTYGHLLELHPGCFGTSSL